MDWKLEDKLLKMESVPNSYLDHIATYIRYKKFNITNAKQLTTYIKRNIKTAKDLEGFSSKQIYAVMEKLQEEQEYRAKHKGKADNWTWGLETVLKTLLK